MKYDSQITVHVSLYHRLLDSGLYKSTCCNYFQTDSTYFYTMYVCRSKADE